MKRLRKIALETGVVVGWILIVCSSLLFVAERTGFLANSINRALSGVFDSPSDHLTIEGVSLDWFEPALRVRGLRLESQKGVDLELDSARLVFAPLQGGRFGLDRVELDRAHLRLSESLSGRIRQFVQEDEPTGEAKRGRLPSLIVNALEVELETPEWGLWPIGELDLRYSAGSDAPDQLSGRLKPEAWWAGQNAKDIQIHGSEVAAGVLEFRALARGLSLNLENLPEGLPIGDVKELKPSARLDLQGRGTVYLDGSRPPSGTVQVAIAKGEVLAPDVAEPVRNLSLALEAVFAPEESETLFDFEAWDGRAVLGATWREIPVAATARVGHFAREGHHAEAWLSVPDLYAPDEHVEEMLALLRPIEGIVSYVAHGLGARGKAALTVALALDKEWSSREPLFEHMHEFVHVRSEGTAEITYHGPHNEQGERLFGFPVPVREVSGDFLFSRHPHRPQPGLMGLVDLRGSHGAGPVRCTGILSTIPPEQDAAYPPLLMDLTIVAEDLAINETLHAGTYGLRGSLPEDELWGLYGPESGSLGLDLRLVMESGRQTLASRVGIELQGTTLHWAPIPVPLRETRGLVQFFSDGQRASVSTVRIASEIDTAEALDLSVRMEHDPEHGARQHASAMVHKLSLKGDDVRILAAHQGAVATAIDAFGPKGFVDARCTWAAGSDGAAQLTVDLTPNGPCEIDPRVFPMNTRDLRGRVLVGAERAPTRPEEVSAGDEWSAHVRAMPVLGTWGAGIEVALCGEFGDATDGKLALQGAGIESSNRRLLGSLAESIASGQGRGTRLDLTSLIVDGRLDFSADLQLMDREGTTGLAPNSEFLVFLRENDLVSERGFHLDRLDGRVLFDIETGDLRADSLDAMLGSTAVRLTNPRMHKVGEVLRLETGLEAQGLPLDREHLSIFVDADTLDALLAELQWRGTIDVHDAELTFDVRQDGTTSLTLRGPATLSDVFMQVGVPVSIRSAQAHVNSLVFEGGTTRAWGHLSDLFGTIAGRSLESTEMLVSYVEPRVSLENVEGHFIDSEGRVFPLGTRFDEEAESLSSPGGSAFAIDLRAPFPFEAAFALENVDVAGLTQGLFATDIANSGRLQGEMRLTGNLEELLDIRGSGHLSLSRGQLWSVPVVRTLFSQLGLDDTAVFDSMGMRFDILDGVIQMKELEAHSPILKLVGSGTLDFDGRLHHDLEVNYSLIDKLGFLRKFLYSIQNSLLRIAIRGDMERPQVILKSFFSDWRGETETHALPLPDVSGLPRRF